MTNIQDIINFDDIDLMIFDLDGTLSEYKTHALLPNVKAYFAQHNPRIKLAIATNQGGVGLRYWMENKDFGNPKVYPSAHDTQLAIEGIVSEIGLPFDVYISFAYQTQKQVWSPTPPEEVLNPQWSRHWRKPSAGMLAAAMEKAGVSATRTLMIGDWEEDRAAAKNAGCFFVYDYLFFNRPKPEEEHA